MHDTLIAAVLQCRVAEVTCKLEAMRTANLERIAQGYGMAYGEDAFRGVIEEVGIHHNAIWSFIQESRDQ